MKKIKYSFAILLFIILFAFIGESYMYHLDNFTNSYYQTSMYRPNDVTSKQMMTDIETSAQKNHVDVFIIQNTIQSDTKKKIQLYGTSAVKKVLADQSQIEAKKYTGILSGETDVSFDTLDQYETPPMKENDFYLSGSAKNVDAFKSELIDQYGGNFPRPIETNHESRTTIFLVTSLVLSLLLLLTFYDSLLQKRAFIIKNVYGESTTKLVFKNVWMDMIIFSVLFVGIGFVVSLFTNDLFYWKVTLLTFLLFLLINTLIYFQAYFYHYKSALTNSQNNKSALGLNYALKIFIMIITLTILAGNFTVIAEGISYYMQYPFFKEHADYSYVELNYCQVNDDQENLALIDQSAVIREEFYQQYLDRFNAIQLANLSGNLDFPAPLLLANKNAVGYLKEQIPKLKSMGLEEKVYYLVPDTYKHPDVLVSKAQQIFSAYEGNEKNKTSETINYSSAKDILSVHYDFLYKSAFIDNPVIILNNTPADLVLTDIDHSTAKTYYAYDTMYRLDEDEFHRFLIENHLEDQIISKTNVLDLYEYNWRIIKRSILLSSILSCFLLLIDIILIYMILSLEYKLNVVELAIKKVLGYSMWEKNVLILIMPIFTAFVSTIIAIILGSFFDLSQSIYIIYAGILLLLFDLCFTLVTIKKIEKTSIVKTLKGGAL